MTRSGPFTEAQEYVARIMGKLAPGRVKLNRDRLAAQGVLGGTLRAVSLLIVRAGRDQVVQEVTASGFRLVGEPALPREGYFLRFERVGGRTI